MEKKKISNNVQTKIMNYIKYMVKEEKDQLNEQANVLK